MSHTFSVCTPTPVFQVCHNQTDGDKSFSFNLGLGPLQYSYTLPLNQCTTQYFKDKQVTVCPDVTSTIYFNSPISIDSIQQKLKIIDLILEKAQIKANQSMSKINNLSDGVSAGMEPPKSPALIEFNIMNLITSQINVDMFNLINQKQLPNHNSIKCHCCGQIARKNYLLDNQLYWCQMCSIGHVFTPYNIIDFAPFNNIDDLKKLNDDIKKQHIDVYCNNKSYWKN